MSNVRGKLGKSYLWSAIDSFSSVALHLSINILLARLLTPSDFGVFGMTAIFIALGQTFVDSGFSFALIRKDNCDEIDYSTIFIFNIGIATIIYLGLFFSAHFVSDFYNNPEDFVSILRLITIVFFFNAALIVPQTRLSKALDFKSQALVNFGAILISGILAIVMALNGYGVWSLVFRSVFGQMLRLIFYILLGAGIKGIGFRKKALFEMFSFGSKILFIHSMATVFRNVYYLIIGRLYDSRSLGIYTQADNYSSMASSTIGLIINKVTFPYLVKFKDDDSSIRTKSVHIFKVLFYANSYVMLSLIIASNFFFEFILGKQWSEAIFYFNLLCLAYMALPFHLYNQIILNIKGKSDLFLKTEIIKYIILIPILIIGIRTNILILVLGFVIHMWIGSWINGMYSKRLIGISFLQQARIFLPLIALNAVSYLIVFLCCKAFGFQTKNLGVTVLLWLSYSVLSLICLFTFYKSVTKIPLDYFLRQLTKWKKQ